MLADVKQSEEDCYSPAIQKLINGAHNRVEGFSRPPRYFTISFMLEGIKANIEMGNPSIHQVAQLTNTGDPIGSNAKLSQP